MLRNRDPFQKQSREKCYSAKSFVDLHEHTINKKVEIMVEHFVGQTMNRIGGKASNHRCQINGSRIGVEAHGKRRRGVQTAKSAADVRSRGLDGIGRHDLLGQCQEGGLIFQEQLALGAGFPPVRSVRSARQRARNCEFSDSRESTWGTGTRTLRRAKPNNRSTCPFSLSRLPKPALTWLTASRWVRPTW